MYRTETAGYCVKPMLNSESPAYVVQHDGWGELVMNRPKRRNALTPDMIGALRKGLASLMDTGSNAIVLRGEGGTFCSGLDLDVYSAGVPEGSAEDSLMLHVELFECPAIIVGALERYAINGGAAYALACDVLVAGATAQLRIGEVKQGAPAPMNVAWLTARTTESVAMTLAGLGEPVLGPDLLRLGLASEVVADDQVLSKALEIAANLGSYPADGPRSLKAGIRANSPVSDAKVWFSQARSAATNSGWVPQRVD